MEEDSSSRNGGWRVPPFRRVKAPEEQESRMAMFTSACTSWMEDLSAA